MNVRMGLHAVVAHDDEVGPDRVGLFVDRVRSPGWATVPSIPTGRPWRSFVADYVVEELTAEETFPLRLEVLRRGTPSRAVAFAEDDLPGTVHLGIRDGDGVVAVSTWIPSTWSSGPDLAEPAVQLRGMATAAHLQGRGLGGIVLDAGRIRAEGSAPVVWARARDTALVFYARHGFTIDGDGFVDEHTAIPHHLIIRRRR
ncbi:MAG: hypothetical protein ABI894_02005 [Ilumatobacteraceae bacterium]